MSGERRAILALVAAGRISAGDAERLLRVGNDARQELGIIAACVLICAAQLHLRISLDGLTRLIEHTIGTGLSVWNTAGHTVAKAAEALLFKGMGGTI
jgi:hypothetical protein